MTPLMIEIGLHYRCTLGDFRNGDFSAPVILPMLLDFVAAGLLEDAGIGVTPRFKATEGLAIWVEALCRVPWPVQHWVMPEAA